MMKPLVILFAIVLVAPQLYGDDVILVTGEQLTGKVVEVTPEHVILEHPVLGRLTIPSDKVESVAQTDPPEAKPAEAVDAPKAEPSEVIAEPETSAPGGWLAGLHAINLQLEIGVNGAQGNSETADLRIAAKVARETEVRRWVFDSAYFYATSNGDSTRNDLTLGLVHDWLQGDSPLFVFAKGRADFDDFQDWDARANGAAGLGYEWIETEKLTVRLRAGAGAIREFGSDDTSTRPEGNLGGELNWQIKPGQRLAAAATVFPSFDEAGEVRVRASLDWTLKINHADATSLKLGIVEEYDSLAAGATRKNDIKYYAALVIDF